MDEGFYWEKIEIYRPMLFRLYFDGALFREISCSIIPSDEFFKVFQKEKLSLVEIEEKLFSIEFKGAYSFLIRQLAKRQMSELDVIKILKRHKVSPTAIQETLEKVKSRGFVSDQLLEEAVLARLKGKRKSAREISIKMKERFGEKCEVKEIVDDRKTLCELLEKKFYKEFEVAQRDQKARNRLIGKLIRRGFSYTMISEVLYQTAEITEEE